MYAVVLCDVYVPALTWRLSIDVKPLCFSSDVPEKNILLYAHWLICFIIFSNNKNIRSNSNIMQLQFIRYYTVEQGSPHVLTIMKCRKC